jgi:hypothetical protein
MAGLDLAIPPIVFASDWDARVKHAHDEGRTTGFL